MVAVTGTPRSLFTDGVEVKAKNLEWTETSKIIEILRRYSSVVTQGIQTGLEVTVNGGDPTLLDIATGEGYTNWINALGVQNGAVYVQLASASPGVALADPTLGVVNVVSLVAADSDSNPAPHEEGTGVYNTKADAIATIEVLTQAAYNALTDAEKGLRCILALVTANGAGSLAGRIVIPTPFISAMTAVQPVSITGIKIVNVSPNTIAGTGKLTYTATGAFLKWKCPGGAYGADVNINTFGYHTLVSGSTTLIIQRTAVALPVGNTVESITVSDLYVQLVNLLSGVDAQHRNMIGSGLPTVTNPHGTLLSDIGGDIEVEQARGSMSLLDDRLDVALNDDGTIKASAIAELINHNQLANMPDLAVTPATAVADHDARYGGLMYVTPSLGRFNSIGHIVNENETHRDAISRLNGALSPLIVATVPTQGDNLVGHNFDATIAPGWSNAQGRSIINVFARMLNQVNIAPIGIYYNSATTHVTVPAQTVNCAGSIRWMITDINLDWTYLDAGGGTTRIIKYAYYVYLKPDVAPGTSYTPVISHIPAIRGYHPAHTTWVYIGSFITDDTGSGAVIPFTQSNGTYILGSQALPKRKIITFNGASAVAQYQLINTNLYVVPATARFVKIDWHSEIVNPGVNADNFTLSFGDSNLGVSGALLSATVFGWDQVISTVSRSYSNGYVTVPLGASTDFYMQCPSTMNEGTLAIDVFRNGWIEDLKVGKWS